MRNDLGAEHGMLAWENLAAQPARRAMWQSMTELLARPTAFFSKMSLTGGLHEPLTFFALVLTAQLLLAFPAAITYFLLTAPTPGFVPAEQYRAHLLPVQATGLCLALLPFVLAAGCGAMVFLGTVFHLPGKLFGNRNWEGSLSVWLYSGGGALVPLVLATALTLCVCLTGYLLSVALPGIAQSAAQIGGWAAHLSLGAGLIGGVALVLVFTTVGSARAFGLEPVLAAAGAVTGVLMVLAVFVAAAMALALAGLRSGMAALGVALASVACLAIAGLVVASLRAGAE